MVLDHEGLIRKAEQLGLSAADLSGTIHDVAAELAAQTTDAGLVKQLRFLSRDCGWSKSEIEQRLEELARRKPDSGDRGDGEEGGRVGPRSGGSGRGHPRHRQRDCLVDQQPRTPRPDRLLGEGGGASVDEIEQELSSIAKEKREQT